MRMNVIAGCLLLLAWVGLPAALVQGQTQEGEAGAAREAPVDPIADAIRQINEQDNGVTVDAEGVYVDVVARVCMRHGDFLEMFACTPDTREHESILVTDAMPSTIHLGFLLLGQEPGHPLSYDMKFDPPKLVPATGPKVQVFIVIKVDEVEREIPANRWVQDTNTEEMMEGNTWLFAGSHFAEYQGKQIYHADLNGSAISLVNFGDDLLTLPNTMTDANESHGKVWAPRSRAIPNVGTEVVIRLRVQAPEAAKEQDKAQGEAADDARGAERGQPPAAK